MKTEPSLNRHHLNSIKFRNGEWQQWKNLAASGDTFNRFVHERKY